MDGNDDDGVGGGQYVQTISIYLTLGTAVGFFMGMYFHRPCDNSDICPVTLFKLEGSQERKVACTVSDRTKNGMQSPHLPSHYPEPLWSLS